MLEHCGECGTDYAVGLTVCPHCGAPRAEFDERAGELVDMIDSAGDPEEGPTDLERLGGAADDDSRDAP